MKKSVLFLSFMVYLTGGHSQTLTPEVNSSAGDFFTGTTATLSWTLGESVIETFSGTSAILTQGFQQPITDKPVSGKITYDNLSKSKMTSVKVYLDDWSGIRLDSAVSNSNGFYWYTALPLGSYITEAVTSKPWGGVNATDALGVMRHFVNMQPLTGMKLLAADVDASGYVNTVDALNIARRFVNMITYFTTGDWLFEKDTLYYYGEGLLNNFRAICYGDVDGSYVPAAKASPAVNMEREGINEILSTEELYIPVTVKHDLDIGAISLVLSYPQDVIDILDIIPAQATQQGGFVFNHQDGKLRIAWYNIQPMHLSAGQTLLTLKTRVLKPGNLEIRFTALAESELADPDATKIESADLSYPGFSVPKGQFNLNNYPNPFSSRTSLLFTLPEDAYLTIKVYNAVGQELATLWNESTLAGSQQLEFDATRFEQGAYLCKATATGKNASYEKSCLMVITR